MVAGLGIEPSSGGYEPPGFPVSLPAEPDVGVEPPCLLTKEMTSRKSAPGKHRAELGSASSCMESKSLTSRPTVRESDQRGSNSFFLPGKQACNQKHLGRVGARDGTRIRVICLGKAVPSLSATLAIRGRSENRTRDCSFAGCQLATCRSGRKSGPGRQVERIPLCAAHTRDCAPSPLALPGPRRGE